MALEDQLGKGWYNELKHCFSQPWWNTLHQNVKARYSAMRPAPEYMFRAFRETPYESLKVVLLGQDPYPSAHACGLAFSSELPNLPKSLEYIYKELEREYEKVPSSGDLSHWARQGVLLLNTSLSVDDGMPGSHGEYGWQHFTSAVLNAAVKHPDIIIVAWGKPAQLVSRPFEDRATVLKGYHPMAEAYSGGMLKFIGNGHFTKINQLLTESNKDNIQWIF